MPMLDIFRNSPDAFNTVELTDAINIVPNNYGRLRELNLFPARGIRTTKAAIERKNGVLNLLPSAPRGGPASKGTIAKRDLRDVRVPHFPHEDMVLAEDVEGIRAFGSENQLRAVQDLVNEKLETMRSKHDITLEFLRWGALTGEVLDADGTTLLDLFSTFEITQEEENFALTTGGTDVAAKVRTLKRYMEQNAKGAIYSGIHVMCSSGFFEALISHTNVEKFFVQFMNTLTLNEDYRNRFPFQGVVFEEHIGQATTIDGEVKKFIADNEAIAFPIGTSGVFQTYFAPADFIETVNTPGLPVYAKQKMLDYDRGVEIHTQSNPLPICLRPDLLVKLTKA